MVNVSKVILRGRCGHCNTIFRDVTFYGTLPAVGAHFSCLCDNCLGMTVQLRTGEVDSHPHTAVAQCDEEKWEASSENNAASVKYIRLIREMELLHRSHKPSIGQA